MTDLRSTQATAYALGEGATSLRTTQAVAYALAEHVPDLRTTQVVAYALVDVPAPLRVTQAVAYALVTPAPCNRARCRCYMMTRTDGVVLGFTDHDEDVEAFGITFSRCASLSSSAAESSSRADATGDVEFLGIFNSDHITQEDLYAGRYDGALVEVWDLSWDRVIDPLPARRITAGWLGRVKQGETTFTAEALSAGGRLQQRPLLETVTPHCRYQLFDSRCKLNRATYLVTGDVTALATRDSYRQTSYRTFTDASRGEADDWFSMGKITWTSGPNTGLSSEIKDFADGVFTLWEPLPYPIGLGDAYEATPGCDFLKATCKTKFSNVLNWGGFDDLPGTDNLVQSPTAKQGPGPAAQSYRGLEFD